MAIVHARSIRNRAGAMLTALEFSLHCTRGSAAEPFRVDTANVRLIPGEVLALTGPSGCGKSTVLEILGLILRPDAGSRCVWHLRNRARSIDVVDPGYPGISQLRARLREQALGFVMQSGGLLPFLTVRENVALPRMLSGQSEWSASTDELVEVLEIGQLLSRWPAQLSIGERQRVAVARALAHDPWLVLADEPTAALDPARSERVMRLFDEIVRLRARIGVVVTHDYDLVRRLGLRHLRAQMVPGERSALFRVEA
jgi:putative ABC transport system ATP-binding protein